MKKLLALSFLVLAGCSSATLKQSPCDAVINRDELFVCGKKDVAKNCRPVSERSEYVCDEY